MEKEFKLQDSFEHELHVTRWKPNIEVPIGIVQIVHGKGEHIGRYKEFAEYLNTLGLLVIGHDQLGHGKTSLEEDYIHFEDESGMQYLANGVDTIRHYIEEKYPRLPIIMFAHSMGSFVGRYALLKNPTRYDMACFAGTGWANPISVHWGLILSWIIKLFKGPRHISKVMTMLTDKAPNSMMKNGIINRRIDWISSDRDKIKERECDELCKEDMTITAQRDLLKLIKATQNAENIKDGASSTAILFISGELDAFGEYGFTVQRLDKIYRRAGYSNVKFSVVNGNRHELINEKDRKKTMETIGNWIIKRLSK